MPEGYDTYSVNYPHQAAWLVYFNGLEVPVSTVTVEYGVNKIATCNVDMPPDPRLVRLGNEDRIELDVFYLDEYYVPPGTKDVPGSQFCLMGEFDIVGWAYTNSGSGRSLRFMAIDTAQILQQLNMFYISAVDDIVNAALPPTATNASNFTVPMTYYPASLFLEGLMPQQRLQQDLMGDGDVVDSMQFITSPYHFIKNVFASLLMDVDWTNKDVTQSADPATKLPAAATSAPGKNYFARYIMFRDLYRRFVGLPFIDKDMFNAQAGCFPIIKACQDTEVMGAIQSQLGSSVGPSGSIWDLLNMVLGTMYMEVATIPAPPVAMAEVVSGVMVDLFQGVRTSLDKKYFGVIASHMLKPQCYFGLPPTCNVIFPSMVQTLSLEEQYLPQPTRVYLGEQFLSNIIAAKGNASSAQLTTSTLTTGYPPVVKARMSQYILAQYQNTKNFLIYPEEFYRGPISRQVNAPPWLWMLDQFRNSMNTGTVGGGQGIGTGTSASGTGSSTFTAKVSQRAFAANIKSAVMTYTSPLNVPPDYVWARMYVESGGFSTNTSFQNIKNSGTGAVGLMQIQPKRIKDPMTGKMTVKPGAEKMLTLKQDLKSRFKGQFANKTDDQIDLHDPATSVAAGVSHIYDDMKSIGAKPNDLNRSAFVYSDNAPISRGSIVLLAYVYGAGRAKKVWERVQKGEWKTMKELVDSRVFKESPPNNPGYKKVLDNFIKAWDRVQVIINTPVNSNSQSIAPKVEDQTSPQGAVFDQTKGAQQQINAMDQTLDVSGIQMQQEEVRSLGMLFDLYAQYEYYRARYESRIGAVVLAFNPYIVPSFPAVMFDSKYSGISTLGYVLNVTHQMSAAAGAPNMTTTVNSAFQRTLSEAMANERQGWDDTVWGKDTYAQYDAYPSEAIPDVAQIFQDVNNADLFYSKVFYLKKLDVPAPEPEVPEEDKTTVAKEQYKEDREEWKDAVKRRDRLMQAKGTSSVFNFRKIVDVVRLGIDGEVVEHDVPSWAYSTDMEIRPSDAYKEHFRSYDAAMSYVARPVCTLQQYIELRHGASLAEAIKAGYVAGEDKSFYSGLTTGKNKTGAKFWARIFLLRQGPGNPSDDNIYKFANCGPASEGYTPIMPNWETLPASSDIPQTRQDWDKILTDYRNMVRAKDSTGGAPRR